MREAISGQRVRGAAALHLQLCGKSFSLITLLDSRSSSRTAEMNRYGDSLFGAVLIGREMRLWATHIADAIVTTPIYALKVLSSALFVRKQDEPKRTSANYHQETLS